jgi:hypothetical protein
VRLLIGTLLAGGTLGCAPTRAGGSPDRPAIPAGDFEPLAIHPEAAAQPTGAGRSVATLLGWRGRLYTGYGDIDANTGPIAVTSWDPATGAFRSHWLSQTEAIYNYRVIGSRLYAPAMDPRGLTGTDYAVGEPWVDRVSALSWHAFDMATLTGDDLWLVGQHDWDAVAWRSLDGGVTWTEALRVRSRPGPTRGLARFYFAGVHQGKLYVQAADTNGTGSASLAFDGRGWTDGPDLLPVPSATGWRPEAVAGRMVYRAEGPFARAGARLLAFDGQQVSFPLTTPVHDLSVSGPELLVLTTEGAVLRTTDLESWTPVATAPAGSRSIGTVGGQLYVGTADSRLYRLRRPLPR